MTTNIGRSDADPTYRYKMPKLVTKIEGRGNGIKTVIVNMVDVAKSLARPASCMFFGCELGAQSKYEEKTTRAVVNGKHDTETLAKLLNIFIDKFVLCPTCTLPETDLIIYIKKEDIRRKCKACGADNGVDLMHKLVNFIMNHPDEDPRYVKVVGGKGDKKKKQGSDSEGDPDVEAPPEDVVTAKHEDDVEWFTDTSADAVAKRQAEALAAAKVAAGEKPVISQPTDVSDEDLDAAIDELRTFSHSGKKTSAEISEVISKLSSKYKIGASLPGVIFEGLFDAAEIANQIVQYESALAAHIKGRDSQLLLLGCFERMCKASGDVLKRTPFVLKAFYDHDIVDEDTLLFWASHPTRDFVRKSFAEEIRKVAAPFLKWLEEADTESDEESDEESEEESSEEEPVVRKPTPTAVPSRVAATTAQPAVSEEDDIDIDDI